MMCVDSRPGHPHFYLLLGVTVSFRSPERSSFGSFLVFCVLSCLITYVVCSFVRSLVGSFVRSFVPSFVPSLDRSIVRLICKSLLWLLPPSFGVFSF